MVQRRASQWGWDGSVNLALRLPRDMVGAAVPDGVLRSLQPEGFDEGILPHAREQLFADRQIGQSLSPDFARTWGSFQGFVASVQPCPVAVGARG